MRKRLIISIKSPTEALEGFKKAYNKAKQGKIKEPHFEISFDSKKSFEKFAKNIYVLSSISVFKPQSIYELAKITGMDVSNLSKIIVFFEEMGAVKIKKKKVNGREVKIPTVEYDEINFDLKAA